MLDTKQFHRPVGVFMLRPNDLKEVGKRIFPDTSTAKRLEAVARLMGFRSAAAYQALVKDHKADQRFDMPIGKPIVDDVLRDVVGMDEFDPETLGDLVQRALNGLEAIGYLSVGGFMPALMPAVLVEQHPRIARKGEWPAPFDFNKMICTDIQYVSAEGEASFSEEMLEGDPGLGICDRLWIARRGDRSVSWAHPVLEAGLRRAVRNPDIVEWIVEDAIRSAGTTDGMRCEREAKGFIPIGLVAPEDIERSLRDEIAIVGPYLESLAEWLHKTSPEWRAPEEVRCMLRGLGQGSMSLRQAYGVVEDLQDRHSLDVVLMAEIAGLSQIGLPLGEQGGLPLPEFCLAAGLGLLADPASVVRPTPQELEDAIRRTADAEKTCDAYYQLVLESEVIDVLAREIAVSRDRGVRALHVRIEMSVG